MFSRFKQWVRNVLPGSAYNAIPAWRGAGRRIFSDYTIFLRSRSGPVARFVRHPMPMSAPWRRAAIDVARKGAIGDVLMCTPALRELKRRNPKCHIRFYTELPALVRGLSYIDEVLPFSMRPKNTINLQYENALPPLTHIARIIGDNLGLLIRDVHPDCMVDADKVGHFRRAWQTLPTPHIVVQRRAGPWTPNKDWPDSYWVELIKTLCQKAAVIEIGSEKSKQQLALENYVDLRGQTSLEDVVAVVANADVVVGPVSGPLHIAAAMNIPAVEIIGGYEHPKNTFYEGNIPLYTPVACAPCWLQEPCPYELKCLQAIQPATVEHAVWDILNRGDRKFDGQRSEQADRLVFIR